MPPSWTPVMRGKTSVLAHLAEQKKFYIKHLTSWDHMQNKATVLLLPATSFGDFEDAAGDAAPAAACPWDSRLCSTTLAPTTAPLASRVTEVPPAPRVTLRLVQQPPFCCLGVFGCCCSCDLTGSWHKQYLFLTILFLTTCKIFLLTP